MRILVTGLIALCILGAALFSIQNATAVSVTFFIWHSIRLPLGVVLAFSFVTGLMLAVVVPRIWQMSLLQEDFDEVSFADGTRLDNDSATDWE
jgi:lipopolysaccharide assembly protein A